MANTTFDWKMREVLPYFRESGRLAVFLSYTLHANERSRAWPSVETLMKETGYSRAYVVAAKQWLQLVGVLTPIPDEKRIGNEVGGHKRDVLEISGRATIDGKTYSILYANSSENEPLPGNSSDSEPSNSSSSERSTSEPEVSTSTGEVVSTGTDSGAGAPTPPAAGEHPDDGEKPKPLTEWQQQLKAMAEPMCVITGDDMNIERIKTRAGTIAGVLIKAGYGPADLPIFLALWKKHDWRGQKNQPPTLEQVNTELPRLIKLHGRAQAAPGASPFGEADQANKEFAAKLKEQRAAQQRNVT